MKTNKKSLVLSLITVLTVSGMSLGSIGFAQTVTPVGCSIGTTSVGVNQPAILTASGGNGSYVWSGTNLNITNAMGNQFAVSYPSAGTYSVNVSSAGLTATCNVNVIVSTNLLSCFPATQNVTLGQVASVSASGGSNAFVWSSPDLSISNPNGSGFSASYASTGVKTLTVTSGGLVTTCAVNVLAGPVVNIPPVVIPSFPTTGGGNGQ